MIKPLGNNDGVKMSSTVGGQRELIRQYRNKINEIIQCLNAREEISDKDWSNATKDLCSHCHKLQDDCTCSSSPVKVEIPESSLPKGLKSVSKMRLEPYEYWKKET